MPVHSNPKDLFTNYIIRCQWQPLRRTGITAQVHTHTHTQHSDVITTTLLQYDAETDLEKLGRAWPKHACSVKFTYTHALKLVNLPEGGRTQGTHS